MYDVQFFTAWAQQNILNVKCSASKQEALQWGKRVIAAAGNVDALYKVLCQLQDRCNALVSGNPNSSYFRNAQAANSAQLALF
jgi:hypothetical protein